MKVSSVIVPILMFFVISCVSDKGRENNETEDVQSDAVETVNPKNWSQDGIYGAFYSPNGKFIAAGDGSGLIKLFDSELNFLGDLVGHTGSTHSTLFDPNSTRIISSSNDAKVKVWDVHSMKELRSLDYHNKGTHTAIFSNQHSWVASCGADSTAIIYDLDKNEEVKRIRNPHGSIHFVWFSNDDKYFTLCGDNGFAEIWEVNGWKKKVTISPEETRLYCIVIDNQNRHIVSSGMDGYARIYDVETGEKIKTIDNKKSSIFVSLYSFDDRLLATSDDEGNIKVYDEAYKPLKTITAHDELICTLHFSPDGKYLLSSGMDGILKIWNVETSKLMYSTTF